MKAFELHPEAWERLQKGRNQMAHAILLSGPAGNLKSEFAYEFAASLLCEMPAVNGEACHQCLACNWFSQGNHPDFRWLRPDADDEGKQSGEGAKAGKEAKLSREITIDQVRALADFLNVGTHRSGLRVILITPAEAMNRNTANAVLKSLEEPRPGTVFLLVSNHSDQLLPTIRSRCRQEPLPCPSLALAQQYLLSQKVSNPERWLALSGGAPRLAMQVAVGNQKRLVDLLEKQLISGHLLDPLKAAAEIDALLKSDKSINAHDVIEWSQRWMHDLAQISCGLSPSYYVHLEAALRQTAGQLTFRLLSLFIRKMVDFKKLAHHPLNSRLFFEDFFSEYLKVFSKESVTHG